MTRINPRYTRIYIDGVDVSGYANQIGSLDWLLGVSPMAAFSDAVKNAVTGHATISAGTVNAFLDNDAAGLFALANAAHGTRNLTVAYGINTEPIAGNPVFAWTFEQTDYQAGGGDGFVPVTIPVSNASYASTLTYKKPWGVCLQPKATVTEANTTTGIDDLGAASALGGLFIYHLFSSDGTVTLTAQDAETNLDASFADITGATSGSITAAVTPKSGIVALGTTAAVRRYLRPQIALGTASTCVYFSAFIRNSIP
jgi:hypothetical protein